MPFQQTFHNTTNVYNIEGNLILNAQSTPADLNKEIASARKTVAETPDLPDDVRAKASAALDAAEVASKAEKPQGATIKGHLETAAQALDGVAGVVVKAGALAKTLVAIGVWAASVL